MFGKKNDRDNQAAQRRLAEMERDIGNLRDELARLESQRDALRAEVAQTTLKCEVADKIYASMQGFGESFAALQQSQVAAATALQEEKQHAIQAAEVSVKNREAVTSIADSLEGLSGDTLRASQNVQGLTERARADRQHCAAHQGNRRPDQSAGLECRHRGGTGRRAGARFCRGSG